MSKEKIPHWPFRFLAWFCPPALYEGIEGDLLEQFEEDIGRAGKKVAKRKLVLGVFKFFRPEIILRNRFSFHLMNMIMFGNYFRIAIRNIQKRKLYSFINAFGLSIGIAFCMLIYLFIEDERSFDQFQVNKDIVYRIHDTGFNLEKYKKGEDPYNRFAHLPAPLGDVMLSELAEVQYMTRFTDRGEGVMRYQDKIFNQHYGCVDSGFFKMFSFPILEGNSEHLFRNREKIFWR
jgi:putative ABC transport system permease protein